MKKIMLYFGAAVLLVLSSCSKEDASAPKTHPMTIGVSLGEATKSALSVDGTGLKRAWKEGDALVVLCPQTKTIEKFTLVEGAGTTQAKFANASSALPLTGSYEVTLCYPYGELNPEGTSIKWDFSTQAGTLESAGDLDLLGNGTTLNDGILPNVELKFPKCYFVHFPKGLQLLTGADGTVTLEKLTINGAYPNFTNYFSYEYWEVSGEPVFGPSTGGDSGISVKDVTLTDGCLDSDIYLSIFINDKSASGYKVSFNVKDESKEYTYPIGDVKGLDRKLYHFKQSNFSPVLAR